MEEENLIPFGQSFIGISCALTANLMASTKQIPLHIHLEIKEGETLTNFVDGVVDSSRYYVVRIKVSCLLTHLSSFLINLVSRTCTPFRIPDLPEPF